MDSIEKHCSGTLAMDPGDNFGHFRGESFHIHPHYELMVCTYPIELRHILCGQRLTTDHPTAILVSPFVPHFTYANPKEIKGCTRIVYYFDNTVLSACPLPFSMKDLLGGGAVRVFNLSLCCQTMRQYQQRVKVTQDQWEQYQLFSMIMNRLYHCRTGSTVLMNRSNDYIFEVIDYITTHLDEKLTVEILAAHFFVSPDKLKKNFKQSTYTNIGDFIQEMRLNRAKELLGKRVPVNEVIRQCGYESSSYFFKRFKEETGTTPFRFGK